MPISYIWILVCIVGTGLPYRLGFFVLSWKLQEWIVGKNKITLDKEKIVMMLLFLKNNINDITIQNIYMVSREQNYLSGMVIIGPGRNCMSENKLHIFPYVHTLLKYPTLPNPDSQYFSPFINAVNISTYLYKTFTPLARMHGALVKCKTP